eukprot:scaffold2841_cov31-Attheya_sp.AAC.2
MNSKLKVTHISDSIKYLYRLPVRSSSQVMRDQDANSQLESHLQQIIGRMRFHETLDQLPFNFGLDPLAYVSRDNSQSSTFHHELDW